ncbi:YadA-like family protein [Mergibacter septicus]|nr:YadA-like family protein [Mergibacter septicus]UTU48563.1 YadA-like family protein [Mergibacter septicus]WMR95808.1 YadA-like family protein [Mergibacter septicus]
MNKTKLVLITPLFLSLSTLNATATTNLELGRNSLAIGGGISTGTNTIAIGRNAVATGDNLTADQIKQRLRENAERLNQITAKEREIARLDADYKRKYRTALEVKQALAQIAEKRQYIETVLNPALADATKNLNDYRPIYDEKRKLIDARTHEILTLDGFDLGKVAPVDQGGTENGLELLAQELKSKAEDGYNEIINNDLNYYKDYINNYIKAKGDLVDNKLLYSKYFDHKNYFLISDDNKILGRIGYEVINNRGEVSNELVAINNNNTIGAGHLNFYIDIDYNISPTRFGTENLRFDENYLSNNINVTKNNEKVGRLSDEDKSSLIKKLESVTNTQIQNINKFYSLSPALITSEQKEAAKNAFLKLNDFQKQIANLKIEILNHQYHYDNDTTENEKLRALQKKVIAEDALSKLLDETRVFKMGEFKTALIPYRYNQQNWYNKNIKDVEELNSKFVTEFKANLERAIAKETAKLNDLTEKQTAANRAIENENAAIARLEPTADQKETARQADSALSTLEREKQALAALKESLTLNNVNNIGENAIAIGVANRVTGRNSISLGNASIVTNENNISIGNLNTITGVNSVVIGNNSTINSDDNIVIGSNITVPADITNSVVIGNNSTASELNKTANYSINNHNYNFAGANAISTVSFGSANNERILTNIGAGRISNTSTDAVNGSQLYAVISYANELKNYTDTKFTAAKTYADTKDSELKNELLSKVSNSNSSNSNINSDDLNNLKTELTEFVKTSDASNLENAKTHTNNSLANKEVELKKYIDIHDNKTLENANKYTDNKFNNLLSNLPSNTITPAQLDEIKSNTNRQISHAKTELKHYTDNRINTVRSEMHNLHKQNRAGIASALAISSIRTIPSHRVSLGVGTGYYRGQSAVAVALNITSDNQRINLNLATSIDSYNNVGGSAGFSVGF